MDNVKRLENALNLKKLRLPERPRVVDLRFEAFKDSTGDDALNVTVVVAEDTPDSERIWPAIAPIEEAVRQAVQRAEISNWPYFRYRKPSELGAASR